MAEIIARRQCCLRLSLEASRDLPWRRNGLHMSMGDSRRVSQEMEGLLRSSIYKIKLDTSGWSSQLRSSISPEQTAQPGKNPLRHRFHKSLPTNMASQDSQLRPAVAKKQVSYSTPGSGAPAHHDFGPEQQSSSLNRGSYEKPASGGSEKPYTDDLESGTPQAHPPRPTLFNRTFTQQFRAAEVGEGEVDFATLSQKEKRQVVKTGVLSYIVEASIKNRKRGLFR